MIDVQFRYFNLLYTTLLANCPYDTGNMLRHIKIVNAPGYYKVIISGPSKSGDYANKVNYGNKNSKNYHWVERTCKQVAEIIGDTVKYEIR